MKERGIKAAPLKARAGHNYWYQYDDFKQCLEEGRLYCSDIIKLREASDCTQPYETLNPIDTLLTPPDTARYIQQNRARNLYLDHQDLYNRLALERYTETRQGKPTQTLLIHYKPNQLIPQKTINRIKENMDKTVLVDTVQQWTRYYNTHAPTAIQTCVQHIAKSHDIIVSEGFTDTIYPAPDYQHLATIAVAPGTVIHYNPDRLRKAVKIRTQTGRNQVKARQITPYLKPEKIHRVPPLTLQELKDPAKIAQAYHEPIDHVLTKIRN